MELKQKKILQQKIYQKKLVKLEKISKENNLKIIYCFSNVEDNEKITKILDNSNNKKSNKNNNKNINFEIGYINKDLIIKHLYGFQNNIEKNIENKIENNKDIIKNNKDKIVNNKENTIENKLFYICGQEPMKKSIVEILNKNKVKSKNIFYEDFFWQCLNFSLF